MKTKLIAITIITIAGIALLTAFKQSEGSKKYLMMTISNIDVCVIDENGIVEEKKITSRNTHLKETVDINKEINAISTKGYKLICSTNSISPYNGSANYQYIFEKE